MNLSKGIVKMTKKIIAQRVWREWDDEYDNLLGSDSVIIDLPQGQVEYCILGNGKPLVISHATPGGYDQAKLIAKPFVEKGFKVICWSRPGYLNTPLSTAKSFGDQAELLATLLDYLWIDKAVFYGFSTGSVISMIFAKKYPERVDHLFLENPVSGDILLSKNLTQRESLNSVYFISQNEWFLNIFKKHFHQIPHKVSIKGENYFDESLILDLLEKIYSREESIKIIQMVKTTGPTEKREQGLYNDIYELTRSSFDTEDLTIPYSILENKQDYSPVIFTPLGELTNMNLP